MVSFKNVVLPEPDDPTTTVSVMVVKIGSSYLGSKLLERFYEIVEKLLCIGC